MVRIQTKRVLVGSQGTVQVAVLLQRDTQIIVGLHIVWVESQRSSVRVDGFLDLPYVPESVAEIVLGLDIVRVQAQRLPIRLRRLFGSTVLLKDNAEVKVVQGVLCVLSDRPTQEGFRLVELADTVGKEA